MTLNITGMRSKKQNKDKSNSSPEKWVYVIIVALVVGFGAYGYFKVKQWMRHFVIEHYEKPITGYTITNKYVDDHKPKSHRGYNSDDEHKKEPDYYMEVWYQGKDYKLKISEFAYRHNVNLYYDKEADEVFEGGEAETNLLFTILIGILIIIVIVIELIRWLIKSRKKKSRAKPK